MGVRDLVTGKISSHSADAVILATGGYGNVFFLSTNAMGCNVTAAYRAHKRGAFFANPCYTQIHPTCIPVHGEDQSKLTLMSESLRNDGRVWVPKNKADCTKPASEIPEDARDYFLERKYPSYGNLAPRDIASRAAKEVCDEGRGVGQVVDGKRLGVYLDFSAAIQRLGEAEIRQFALLLGVQDQGIPEIRGQLGLVVAGEPADDLIDFGFRPALALGLLHVQRVQPGELHRENGVASHRHSSG